MPIEPDILNRRSVLIAEPGPFLAGYLQDAVEAAGAQVMGPAASIEEACALVARNRKPDAAVISHALPGPDLLSFLEQIEELQVRPVLIKPYGLPDLPGYRTVAAPFAAFQVVEALSEVLARSCGPARWFGGPRRCGH